MYSGFIDFYPKTGRFMENAWNGRKNPYNNFLFGQIDGFEVF